MVKTFMFSVGINPSVVEHDTFKKLEMYLKNIKQEIKTKIQTQDMFLASEKNRQ